MTSAFMSGLFAVLGLVFAWLAIAASRRCENTLRELEKICAALRSARTKIEVHDAELDRISDALQHLRGKFYAERRKYRSDGSNPDTEPEATSGRQAPTDAATLKAELRRKVGLVAGRPAPHQ